MIINIQSIKKLLLLSTIAGVTTLVSCSKNEDNNGDSGNNGNSGNNGTQEVRGAFFIGASGTDKEYILRADNLESGEINISSNVRQLEQTNYFWSFNRGIAAGLVYQQQEPGKGLAFKDENGVLKEIAAFQINERFTAYGFFKDYFITNVSGQAIAGETDRFDGSTFTFRKISDFTIDQEKSKTLKTFDITKDRQKKEIATISGILDRVNVELLAIMVYSERNAPRRGAGSSIGTMHKYDSIWVAAFDENLALKRIYKSDKLGYSAGRFKSQTLKQLGKADNGDVYVFSGHYETQSTKPAGALRIKKDATEFDSDYFFNIDELSGGYPFRNVFHISEAKFLIEFYNEKTVGRDTGASQYAIVDAASKTLNWITGLPVKEKIKSNPFFNVSFYKGKLYLPIAETGTDAAIYAVDLTTNQATKGLVIRGAENIRAVGRITE